MSAVAEQVFPSFRPLRISDVPAVQLVERQCYRFPWSELVFLNCLEAGYGCWQAGFGTDVVGYGVLSTDAGECHVLNLTIAPRFRGSGYGRMLLRFMLNEAAKRNAKRTVLEVRPGNRAAIQLYLSEGFVQTGLHKHYYPLDDGREDALVFSRTLSPPVFRVNSDST